MLTRFRTLFAAFSCLLSLILGACTMSTGPIGNPEAPYPPPRPLAVGDILHLPTGVLVSKAQMLSNVVDSRVVFVGETHDNPAAHRLQADILTAMAQRYPGRVSLGMEMFNIEQQPVLDRWVAGELEEKSFLKEVRWFDNWSMDFGYYRELLLLAREKQIPVIALNAPKSLVRAFGRQPTEDLDAELRAQLPELDLADPYQRALTEAIYAGHGRSSHMIDGFHRVQTLWDEMMAENVVRTLQDGGAEQRMVVVAGGNHIRFGFGIPRRVYRRMPVSYSLVGVYEIEVGADKQDRTMDVTLPKFPMVPYDYMNFVAYESLPGERVKLGVRFASEDGQVVVEAVVPGSAADRAGILKGDVLLRLGESDLREGYDLVYEISRFREGDRSELQVLRAGEELTLPIIFTALPPAGTGGR